MKKTGNSGYDLGHLEAVIKAGDGDLDLAGTVELVVLSVNQVEAQCRMLESGRLVTLQAKRCWSAFPGEIIVVRPRKQWRYAGHLHLSGEIESGRLDVSALDLVPLHLGERGRWNPDELSWTGDDELAGRLAAPIIARGPRPTFELEEVLPAVIPGDPSADPFLAAWTAMTNGARAYAREILERLFTADLRCLRAHAQLGGMEIESSMRQAARHFETGLRIGELSFEAGFDGVLPPAWPGNKAFLCCVHGYGLCLWHFGRTGEAERMLKRLLWLNPADNLGARFALAHIEAGLSLENKPTPSWIGRCP